MIRIRRVPEAQACPELAQIRNDELDRVRKALGMGKSLSQKLLGTKYQIAKPALHRMQHMKCCYCERREDLANEVTEHYRPKTEADRGADVDRGYWWLTWTWENLLFACAQCNTPKGTKFPLEPHSTALTPEESPPGGERPSLLDPSCEADDPRDHIRFCSIGETYLPLPHLGSTRGSATLEALEFYHPTLGYKRPALVDRWRAKARTLREPITAMQAALHTNEREAIHAVWRLQIEPHLLVSQEFVALTLDVLAGALDEAALARWGLTLEPVPLEG